jgi:hypothetical protein
MNHGNPARIRRYTLVLVIVLILSLSIIPVTATTLTSNRHIFVNVANDAGVKYDLDGTKYGGPSNTYYIKADGGGLNELHITNDTSDAYGQVTTTTDQSGVFYVTNTGGRGFDNDIILLIAVKEPVPDDFSVTIRSSGYTWAPAASGAYTPAPPTDYTYVSSGVSETFTKSDFIYGPQNWKPGPGTIGDFSLPVYNGQDMTDTTENYQLMFIDLKAGNLYPAKFPGVTLNDNGAVKVSYSFNNLHTFASFNGYGWCVAANQDQGISWTNPTKGFTAGGGAKQSGLSGFSVIGITSTSSPAGHSGSSGGGAVLPAQGAAVPVNPDLYGYKGKTAKTVKTGTINGSVRFFTDPDTGPVLIYNRIRDFNLSVDVPPGSNITLARMYLYISDSHYIDSAEGVIPSISTRLNTTFLEPDTMYIDTDKDIDGQVMATCAYDVRELLKGNGTYTFSVKNTDQDRSVFTLDKVLLVTAYENANATNTSYWIDEGCDVIMSHPEKGLFPEDTETTYPFSGTVNMSTAGDAYLYLVATGLDYNTSTEHTVRFNDKKWFNIFDNGSVYDTGSIYNNRTVFDNESVYDIGSIYNNRTVFDNDSVFENNRTFSVTHLQVRSYLNETGNEATVQSSIRSQDADYIVNRNAFLIVELNEPNSSALNSTTSGHNRDASSPDAADPHLPANESTSCHVYLDSDPEGALIYVNDTYSGKITPYTLDVRKGDSRTVRFELDGYSPSVIQFLALNSTNVRESLYTPVHSTKNRLIEEPYDPDGTRYGGLYIYSRPRSAAISINGIATGKTTPAVFMGLEPGLYTVKMGKLQDLTIQENNLFDFHDQTVRVVPDEITLVDISGIGYHIYTDIIVDSRHFRGMPFTLNGYMDNKTIPAKISTPLFESFITIHENESFVSYPVPVPYVWDDVRYLHFEPRDHQNLSISVDSEPRGADIFIDGFRTGYSTPYTVGNLSDGFHRIMVSRNGYLPKQSLIYLPWGSDSLSVTPVDFELEEYPSGFLYVTSIPEGGNVSIDSMYTGEITPALFKTVPTGSHEVKVTWTNQTRTFYDVTINSLYLTNLTADFTPDDD